MDTVSETTKTWDKCEKLWLVKEDGVIYDCPTLHPENYILNVNCFRTEYAATERLWTNLQNEKEKLKLLINLVEDRLRELDSIPGHVTD